MKKMDLSHTTSHGFNKDIGQADTSMGKEKVDAIQKGRDMGTPSQDMPKKYGTRESAVPPPKG